MIRKMFAALGIAAVLVAGFAAPASAAPNAPEPIVSAPTLAEKLAKLHKVPHYLRCYPRKCAR